MGKLKFYIISLLITCFITAQLKAQQLSIYKVKKMPFNTLGFSNIAPVILKDGILFCSDKRFSGFKDRTSFDGRRLYNIYLAGIKDTAFEKPVAIKSERSFKFNNGPFCIAPDGKTVYFTSETETGKIASNRKFKNHSGLFIGEISGSEVQSLHPFKYNDPNYDVGQPSISKDGKYLFFASDKPGGNGGSDLYYCELVNGDWSQPVNLGSKVNSSGSENYPFMHQSGKLYFTSDRPGGFGKMDIYFTVLNNGSWGVPVHLPEPINSQSDDFAFVASNDLQTGYFSSNRGNEDDIYKFTSTIIRKVVCDTLEENNYCYRFLEENAVKYDTMPFRYEWKFGDGDMATGAVVEHCFKGPGTYTVSLDVVNLVTKEVTYNEKTETVVVAEIEQPYISVPDKVDANKNISLSADSTNLPGWKISRYYWNFGDETIAVGKNVTKSYEKPGTYNIQLIVTAEPEPGSSAREACISKNIIVLHQP
jgi:dipeptidyl aminopeptidase/acylaminoacyl peptidase